MGDPLLGRDQSIKLRSVSLDQKKSVQVAAVGVEKHHIEDLNHSFLLQAAQVLNKLRKVLRARLFPAGDGPVPAEQHEV